MNLMQKYFSNRDKNIAFKLIFGLIIGIALILIGRSNKNYDLDKHKDKNKNINACDEININNNNKYEHDLETRLENLLSQVSGVGNIKVMISTCDTKEIIVAQDINSSEIINKETDKFGLIKENHDEKKDIKKIIIDGRPLVLKEIMPKVQGIIIIAQGGDNIFIKNQLIKAAETILNLEAHKIQVLKMK